MSADVTVLISNEKGLVVPSKAVTTVRDRSYVDIITAEGVQETVRVTIGSTDGRNTLVSEGLEEGMAVVLPGTAVPAAAPAAAAGSAGTSIIPISVPGTGQK
jgi:HlyD family secretion protein